MRADRYGNQWAQPGRDEFLRAGPGGPNADPCLKLFLNLTLTPKIMHTIWVEKFILRLKDVFLCKDEIFRVKKGNKFLGIKLY